MNVIALIEDDEAVLESLRLLLESRGLAVHTFRSVEDFLAHEDREAACVVSDVRLPGLSGLDLQRHMKKEGRAAPLILITGHGDIAMAVSAIKDGAFDFIEKPYDADLLIASIERALAADQKIRLREGQKASSSPGLPSSRRGSARSCISSPAGFPTSRLPPASASARALSKTIGRG
jgi:two-component system, LuxR family, response regulator FixJ